MADIATKEINGFYSRYASKEGITLAEAKRRISTADIAEYAKKAEKYVPAKDLSDKANEEMRLYNAMMSINRLEMLKSSIGLGMVDGFDELDQTMREHLTDAAEEEFVRQAGILGGTVRNPREAASTIVNSSFHNATFSQRIWMHQGMLRSELDEVLQEGLIKGESSLKLARHIQKVFGASQKDAERLMRTEMSRVYTEAQKESYEENGYDEYTYIALGDACDICAPLDGKHFKVKQMQVGQNAPPMHPNCRCSTAPWMDRNSLTRETQSSAVDEDDVYDDVGERERLLRRYHNTVQLQALDAPDFVDKFRGITGIKEVDESIYNSAVEILKHRNGTVHEDLYLINAKTGDLLHSLTTCDLRNEVKHDDKTRAVIKEAHEKKFEIIAIHNHPSGLPPSLDDGVSAFDNGFIKGVAVGHNLEVYTYSATNKHYEKEECDAAHNALNEKLGLSFEFDEEQWYNMLRNSGMEVERRWVKTIPFTNTITT